MPLPPVVVAQTAQTGILLLGGSWAGLRLGKPIGLDSPFARALVYRRALPALLRRTLISAALAGCATPSNAPPHVPFTQRRFTTPRSDQTPGPEPTLHPHPRDASTDHDRLPPQGLPSVQTLVQDPTEKTPPQQLVSVHASPAMIRALVRLLVRLFGRLQVLVLPHPLLHRRLLWPQALIHSRPLHSVATDCDPHPHTGGAAHNQVAS